MAVDRAFNTFLDACATSNGYVSRAHTQDSDGKFHLNKDERDLVTVAAFLRLFIAWESFLEETFVLYMMGKLSRNGLSVKAYVSPVDVAHASRMLLGVQRQKFIDWSTPDTLRALAPVVFHQGGPFGAYSHRIVPGNRIVCSRQIAWFSAGHSHLMMPANRMV